MMPVSLPIAGNRESMLTSIFFVVLAASMFSDIHLWVLLLCLCAGIVRGFLFLGWYNHMPGKRMVNLLALLAGTALITTSDGMDFLHIMVNLLLLACALKLMLLSKRRDFYQLFICAIFLLACGFIFYQSLARTLFYGIMFLFLLYILLSAHTPSSTRQFRQKKTFILFFQALPLAVILFVFMPRLPPLWKMPEGKSTETGLAETITPGDIANLAQSEKLAFSATFSTPVPVREQLYWRALTLEHFDGKSWSVSETRQYAETQLRYMNKPFRPALSGEPVRYEVIAEPTKKSWLFALDTAVPDSAASQRELWQGWQYQLTSRQPLFSRYAYYVASYPDSPRSQGNVALDNTLNLQVPEKGNEKTREWVHGLREMHPDNRAFVSALMRNFNDKPFSYTLTPPPMLNDPVDSFLFDHQQGFCAHYASAMTFALRLAGIPARIVTGYQGGTPINDETVNVYQYDAHAWVEAKTDGMNWQSYDPTTMVAPSRIFDGFEQAARFSTEIQGDHPLNGISQLALFDALRNMSAQMDFLWSRWFLGYNNDKQTDILDRILNGITPLKLSLFAAGLLLFTGALLIIYFVPGWQRSHIAREKKYYLGAVEKLEQKFGLQRENRSPGQFYEYCKHKVPEAIANDLASLTRLFEQYQYHPHQAPPVTAIREAAKQLCRRVRNTARH